MLAALWRHCGAVAGPGPCAAVLAALGGAGSAPATASGHMPSLTGAATATAAGSSISGGALATATAGATAYGAGSDEALVSFLVRVAAEQSAGQYFNLAHSVGVLQVSERREGRG